MDRMKRIKGLRGLIASFLFIAVGLGASFEAYSFDWLRAGSAVLKTGAAITMSDADVQKYVRQSVQQMDRRNNVLPSSNAYSRRLARITSGLKSVNGIPLNFKVYRNNEANAFACADGSVRVYTKLMDVMTDNEILGVIGHEIGHVALKHSKKQIRQALLASAARDGLAAGSGTIAALSASSLGALGEAMINAKYSRTQETEADDYGYKFLKSHGKNPYSLALAFGKLKKLGGSRSNYIMKLFSTHPDLDNRIARIKKRCNSEGIPVITR